MPFFTSLVPSFVRPETISFYGPKSNRDKAELDDDDDNGAVKLAGRVKSERVRLAAASHSPLSVTAAVKNMSRFKTVLLLQLGPEKERRFSCSL